MHKFLFGNRRINNSSYSPFSTQTYLESGIINKIKKKIQGLFQTTINSQSMIQRIQPFEDQNLEKELSYQFKNNLVLVDRIIPNKDDKMTLKRKTIFPFEQYLTEESDKTKKLSKATQNDLNRKTNDCQIKTSKTKKQRKFQKDHSKNYKDRKMEENQKQLEFNLNKQNFKKNLYQKQENSSEYLSDCSKKKQLNNCTDSIILLNQQKEQINQLENQAIIQKEDNNKQQRSDSLLKKQITFQSPIKQEVIKIDKQQSSQIVINTIVDSNQSLLKNGNVQEEVQPNIQILDPNLKQSILKQNQEQVNQIIEKSNDFNQIIHPFVLNQKQVQYKLENSMMIKKKEDCINVELQQNKSDNQQFQNSEEPKLIFNQIKGNKDMIQQTKKNIELKKSNNLIQKDLEQYENVNLSNIQINKQKDKINFQGDLLLNKRITSQIDNISQKEQQIQKNVLQTSFVNNLNKQIVEKNEKLIKEQNPFLVVSPNISSDQISTYFQGSSTQNQNKEFSPQNQNQQIVDLFKIPTSQSQSQQINNKVSDKQITQDFQSIFNVNNFNNQKIIPESTNKQIEMIQQIPQITPIQIYNFESVKINYQQQQNNIFQQQQQNYQYTGQLMQQSNYQFQNIFPQQQQTSKLVSSLNLFQSNPYQQQQNDLINQQFYYKNDVLSLFQDTKKSDRDIFQTQSYNQTSQSLNNSFNKSRKKQRINNF